LLKRQNMLLEENEWHAHGLTNLANMLNEALVLDRHDANHVASVRIRLSVLLSR
jgi:hypothetical protein